MADPALSERLTRRFQLYGLAPAETQLKQVAEYIGVLAKWNKQVNLTALDIDPASDDAIDRLIVEPFIAAAHFGAGVKRVVDLGSGGGSPALPMKIAWPDLGLIMVESRVRKAAFLRDVARQLGFNSAAVEHARFDELLNRADLREAADVVSVRAVRADLRFWRVAESFLRPGGRIFWFASAAPGLPPGDGFPEPLALENSIPLVQGSRLIIARKRRVSRGK